MGVITGVTNGGVILTGPSADGTSGQFLRTNGSGALSFAAVDTSSLVTGPASATDNALARFDATTGKLIQNSGVIVDDSDNVTGAATLRVTTSLGIASKPFWNSSADSKIACRNHASSAILFDFGETMAGAFTAQGDVNSTGGSFRFNGSIAVANSFPVLNFNSGATWTSLGFTGPAIFTSTIRVGVFTVATLPTAGTNGRKAYASNGRRSGEGAGAGSGIPAYDDGTNWKTYYDNTTVAA